MEYEGSFGSGDIVINKRNYINLLFIRMKTMWKLKNCLGLLILVIVTFSANCQIIDNNYNINSIKRIKLMGDVNVVCVIDTISQNSIVYPDTVNDWKNILFLTVKNETLTIQTVDRYGMKTDLNSPNPKWLIIKVASDLNEIENGYSSTLKVKGEVVTPSLKVKLSGNGSIVIEQITSPQASLSILTGKGIINIENIFSDILSCDILGTGTITVDKGICKDLKCKTLGTGKMNITGLQSKTATIKYAGGGYIKCHAVETITASGLGTTKICYLGNPNITQKGNVKLHRINENR